MPLPGKARQTGLFGEGKKWQEQETLEYAVYVLLLGIVLTLIRYLKLT